MTKKKMTKSPKPLKEVNVQVKDASQFVMKSNISQITNPQVFSYMVQSLKEFNRCHNVNSAHGIKALMIIITL